MPEIDWIERWNNGSIAFHEGKPNEHLTTHFSRLNVPQGGRVFVPLCGKTVDIHWLLGAGYQVVGAELSELAVTELFGELGVVPNVTAQGKLKRYSAGGIDIFVGDLFDLTGEQVGEVDAVYDRAAFVALPEDSRGRYVTQVARLAGGAPQLLITYAYDESLMSGPPFNIPPGEVDERYEALYRVEKLGEAATVGVRGVPADEQIWLLEQKAD